MKPTFLVFDASAAATPTRNELWFSANSRSETFGCCTVSSSMMANFVFGYFVTTLPSAVA